ncbi:hypothetical protein Hanom_Chr14g01311731 [Helianthus anomalus]
MGGFHAAAVVLLASSVFSYSSIDLKSSEKFPFPNPPHPAFCCTFPSSSFTIHPTLCIISMNIVGLHIQKNNKCDTRKQIIHYKTHIQTPQCLIYNHNFLFCEGSSCSIAEAYPEARLGALFRPNTAFSLRFKRPTFRPSAGQKSSNYV